MADPHSLTNSQASISGDPGFDLPLNFAYRPPRSVLLLQLAAFVLALGAVSVAMLPVLVKLLCYSLLLAYCLRHSGRLLALRSGPGQVLCLSARDAWSLHTVDGTIKLTLRHEVLIHHRLVILNFHDAARQRYDFIFTRENADARLLRILRIRLRHKK